MIWHEKQIVCIRSVMEVKKKRLGGSIERQAILLLLHLPRRDNNR